jgi:Leucine-rich repeat (LRR) protein
MVISADLSEKYKTVEHSFTDTFGQKENTTVVHFLSPAQIDFLPKEILKDFPRMNGIAIDRCETLKTVKDGLFTKDFDAIEYLHFFDNQISTIEANAFQHLPKLKWIALDKNKLRSLPHQIFKNNPEMMAILLSGNQINSITPDFFKNLNKLQWVDLHENECIEKEFGCTTGACLVTQSELDSGLAACYSNILNDRECTAKSEHLDN